MEPVSLSKRLPWLLAIAWFGSLAMAVAPLSADEVDYERDVVPILKTHCYDCHGPDTQESALRLDSVQAALQGGDSGERVVVPGKSAASYLVELVTSTDVKRRMPPEGDRLSDGEVKIIQRWIDHAPSWAAAQAALAETQNDHWSWRPITRPSLDAATQQHAIDTLVQASLSQVGLHSSSRAKRRLLIRRLYLVMLGLPPEPDAIDAYVADERPDAWARLVDRVMASPHYGERWGTHWLDIVRFGETHGFETNRERPNAWRYRDWVIDSLNGDKPYDTFVAAQLAGDQLGDPVGTGFLVAGPYDIVKGQDALLRLTQRQDELADMINATGTAFLGLTLGCARCHNHKFDSIRQSDYYALQAVFSGVQHAESVLPVTAEQQRGLEVRDKQISELKGKLAKFAKRKPLRPAVKTGLNEEQFRARRARFVRFTILETNQGEPCIDELEVFAGSKNVALASEGAKPTSSGDFVHRLHKLAHINDGRYGNAHSWIAKQQTGGWVQIELAQPANIDRIVWARDREQKYADRLAVRYRIEVAEEPGKWETVASSDDRVAFQTKADLATQYDFSQIPAEAESGRRMLKRLQSVMQEREQFARPVQVYAGRFTQPGPTYRLYRGDPTAPREAVVPDTVLALGSLDLQADTPEAMRRLALAKWVASEANPLTARVIVNRLWQFHFGVGLVDTPNDLGANGTAPTHPELLDWLASELIHQRWSLKQLHRQILLSETWQQSSLPVATALQVDAGSRLLWRYPPRRLEAEAIRDSILAVSGALNPSLGGQGFSAFEVQMENVRHYFPKTSYSAEDWRRMIYMEKVRQEKDSVFGVFDCPDASQVVPKRSRSTTPLQALNLLNSVFVNQQAKILAERLVAEAGDTHTAQVRLAYRLAFGRPAEDSEVQPAVEFIREFGLTQFTRALLNSNEFVFVP